jgi:hypothetical protein
VSYRSSNVAQGSGDPLGGAPSGVVAGDRLYAWIVQDNAAATFTIPGGSAWVSLRKFNNTIVDGQTSELFEIKNATGSESYAFTSSTGAGWIFITATFSGRHNTAAAIVSAATVDENVNSSPVSVALGGVTAAAGDDILWVAELDQATGADVWAFNNDLTNYVERQDSNNGSFVTSALYTRDNVSAGATGTLTVTATRTSGADVTAFGGVVVAIPAAVASPTITTQPVNQIVKIGGAATLSVTSPDATSYQWRKQQGGAFADVVGATSATYVSPALAAADSAGYRCDVTNTNGTTISETASVTVARATKPWVERRMRRSFASLFGWSSDQTLKTLSQNELYFAAALASAPKYWNGSAWVSISASVKYWTGAAWIAKPLKRWTGTAWL